MPPLNRAYRGILGEEEITAGVNGLKAQEQPLKKAYEQYLGGEPEQKPEKPK